MLTFAENGPVSYRFAMFIQAILLNPDWRGPWISVRIRQNPDYAYRNYMYRKGLGAPNMSGLDENPDYTFPD